jgi:hypothetical protein
MATSGTGQRTFPALIVVCILLLACLFLGQVSQAWVARQFPGLSGLARLDPALIIMDIPVRLPITIDLILVPVLFLLAYTIVILLHPRRRELPHRLGAIFSAMIIIGCCVAFGGLIAYLLQDHLPKEVRNGLESLGINTDIYLPYTAFKTIHLHGNVIALLSLTIGVAIAIGRINKAPASRKPTRLSRQQRMTPYERMLQEKHEPARPAASKPIQLNPTLPYAPNRPSRALCQAEPLVTLQPEAVNYRPLW